MNEKNQNTLLLTEQALANSLDIDARSTEQVIDIIQNNDQDLPQLLKQVQEQLTLLVNTAVSQIEQGGRIIYVGAGTSGRLGYLDAVECLPTYNQGEETIIALIAGGKQALHTAVEGAEDDTDLAITDLKNIKLKNTDIVIGLSASGTTPYVLSALDFAQQQGCSTWMISNNPLQHSDFSHHYVYLATGPEVVTGSTRMKAGTALKMFLNCFSSACMIKLGHTFGNLMVDMKATNTKLSKRTLRIIDSLLLKAPQEPFTQGLKHYILQEKTQTSFADSAKLLTQHKGHLRQALSDNLKLHLDHYSALILDMDGSMLRYHLPIGFSTWAALGWAYNIYDQMELWIEQYKAKKIVYADIWTLCAQALKDQPINIAKKSLFCSAGTAPYNRGLQTALPLFKKHLKVGILSSGLSMVAESMQNQFHLDFYMANTFNHDGHVFDGTVNLDVPYVDKHACYGKLIKNHKLKPENIIYVGDSSNDFTILDEVGFPIFYITPHNQNLKEMAQEHGWHLVSDYYDILRLFA
ncbi:MAG TPA: N-acetylmuramic acid 6-phosphate etherase [Oligoflexia bacterium]|nr:N-acetylmuramic acid 6-phosphate etherase [Oligoflexia bacterium]HMR25494.1 N-acetylmuramic acid 6-phosphate etherase [Oligoflexia bacterium]